MSRLTTTDLTPPSSSPTVTITADKIYTTSGPTTSTTTTGGYIAYDPFAYTASTTSSPTYTITLDDLNTVYAPKGITKEEVQELTDKVDKHVDQLEEDIDYLNNKLEEHTNKIDHTYTDVEALLDRINALEAKLGDERKSRINLEGRVRWINTLLESLINKLDMRVEDLIC